MRLYTRLAILPVLLAAAAATVGCGATLQTIKIALPVECKEEVPERPIMPTEQFEVKPSLDEYVQASQVEILRREGYEKRLDAALRACTAPIAP